MPGGEYLPPVIAEFKADVADFIAKVEAAKGALKDFKDAGGRTTVDTSKTFNDTGRAADRMASDVRRSTSDTARSWQDMDSRIGSSTKGRMDAETRMRQLEHQMSVQSQKDLQEEIRLTDAGAQSIARSAASDARLLAARNRDYQTQLSLMDKVITKGQEMERALAGAGQGGGPGKFMGWFNKNMGNLPGFLGGGAVSPAELTLGASVGGPMLAGAAWPIAGALTGLAPGAMGSAAMFPFMKDAMGEVTAAFTTLENQTNTYNASAAQTATFLKTDSSALQGYNQLLGQLNPIQKDAIGLLSQQGVQWQNLTPAQQAGVISLRNTKALYDTLPQSMKNELNALLAEQKAWQNLEPAQAQALKNYSNMHTVYDNLRTDAMPAMFQTIAVWEKAAADAMRPLLPLIDGAAKGWEILGVKLDGAFRSQGYKNFIDLMSAKTTSSIVSWGTAIGNLAMGFGRLFEIAIGSGFGDRFNAWLVQVTGNFDRWAHSSAGTDWVTRFMARLEANGPTTMAILGKLIDTLGRLVGMLTANHGTLQILELISQWLLDIIKLPIVGWAVQAAVFAGALLKIADALKILTLAQMGYKALGGLAGIGGAIGALKAGQGLSGAAGAIAGAGGVGAAASTDAAVAGAGAAEASGAAKLVQYAKAFGTAFTAGSTVAVGGAMLGAAAIGVGIAAFAQHLQSKADAAAGIVRHADGSFTAATAVSGQHVSTAYQQMANQVAGAGNAMSAKVKDMGGAAQSRFGSYQQNFQSANDKLGAVMNMAKTNLGQQFGLFASSWGGDVVGVAKALQASGKTLDTAVTQTMTGVFSNMSQQSKASWATWQQNEQTQHKMSFDALNQRSKTDYQTLQTAVSGYIDDANNHLQQKSQADQQKLLQATTQFMTDANNGTILVSQQQINKLGLDIQKFYSDAAKGDTTAAQGDIAQMGRDLSTAYQGATSAIVGQVTQGMSQAQAAAVNEANKLGLNLQSLFNNGGSNPFSTGNGSPAANGTAKGLGGLASGGQVHGPGTGTSDSIPMMLSNKEFVVNAQQSQKHLSLLHAINSGKLGGMAGGGQVSYDPFMQGNVWLTTEAAFKPAIMAEAAFAKQTALMKQLQQLLASAGGSAGAVGPAFALAMALTGVSGADWLSGLEIIAKYESGFNPNAINLTDSNAAAGDPSRGLMQTIMSTFMAYHQAGTSYNIFDPVANIAAAINYIRAVYGSIDNVPGVRSIRSGGGYLPYDNGGWLMPGVTQTYNGTGKPEAVFTQQQLAQLGGGGEVHIYLDGRELTATIRRRNWRDSRRNGANLMALPEHQ